jgi:hypothetical protein
MVSTLADQQDAIDGQLSGPPDQGLGDRGIDRQARMPRGPLLTKVFPRLLIHGERDDVHQRLMMPALPAVAVEEAVDDSLAMRCLAILGDHGGNEGTALHGSCTAARKCRTRRQSDGESTQDLAARQGLTCRACASFVSLHHKCSCR